MHCGPLCPCFHAMVLQKSGERRKPTLPEHVIITFDNFRSYLTALAFSSTFPWALISILNPVIRHCPIQIRNPDDKKSHDFPSNFAKIKRERKERASNDPMCLPKNFAMSISWRSKASSSLVVGISQKVYAMSRARESAVGAKWVSWATPLRVDYGRARLSVTDWSCSDCCGSRVSRVFRVWWLSTQLFEIISAVRTICVDTLCSRQRHE